VIRRALDALYDAAGAAAGLMEGQRGQGTTLGEAANK